MTTYYWEGGNPWKTGAFNAISDSQAMEIAKTIKDLMCLYKESDTDTGLPFVILKMVNEKNTSISDFDHEPIETFEKRFGFLEIPERE